MSDVFTPLTALVPVSPREDRSQSIVPETSTSATDEGQAAKSDDPWALWHPQAGLVVSPNMNYVPKAAAASYRCNDEGKAISYTAPSLLEDEFMYLLFCPNHVENTGDLFGRLNITQESLQGKIVKNCDYYSLNPAIISSWERLEAGLSNVASTLIKMLPKSIPKLTWPRLPVDCGYRHFHAREKFAIASASQSIKAFAFLSAFVSFTLALHMNDEGDLSYVYNRVRRESSLKPEASWFDLLAISYVSNFAPNFRIGGFINPYTSRWMPYVAKFAQAGVPVWLLWGPKKREQPPLDSKALWYWPPPHKIDEARVRALASTSVVLPTYRYDPFAINKGAPIHTLLNSSASFWDTPRSPSPEMGAASPGHLDAAMDEALDVSRHSDIQPEIDGLAPGDEANCNAHEAAVASLNCFFADRARRRVARLAIETPTEKQAREQREAHVAKTKLYTQKSTMYMWVEKADGSYQREQVFSKQFEVEWDNFTPNQRIYTGHLNEWDLCPQYPRYSEENPEEAESDPSVSGESDDEDEGGQVHGRLPLVPILTPTSEVSEAVGDAGGPRQETSGMEELTLPGGGPRVEVVSLLDFIKYRLGCNLFSGANWNTGTQDSNKIGLSKAMMALSFKIDSLPPGPEVGESIVQVVRALSGPSASTFRDLPDSFDHGPSHGLRLHTSLVQVSLVSTATGPLFLVHPPGYVHQCPWAIATVDASTILQIFRRGWQTMAIIARELTRQGTRFSTVSVFDRRYVAALALPIRGLGTRPANFQPTEADYNEYLRRREDLLRGPRGRAALMYGGLIARIARDVLDVDTVLDGPSLNSITVGQHGHYLLFDDRLTPDDLDVICGVYYVPSEGASLSEQGQRGDGSRTHLSWWPQATTWDASRCYLRTEWTELAEEFYQKWLRLRAKSVVGTIFGASSWRSKLRKANKITNAIDDCSECYQSGYLQDYLGQTHTGR